MPEILDPKEKLTNLTRAVELFMARQEAAAKDLGMAMLVSMVPLTRTDAADPETGEPIILTNIEDRRAVLLMQLFVLEVTLMQMHAPQDAINALRLVALQMIPREAMQAIRDASTRGQSSILRPGVTEQ